MRHANLLPILVVVLAPLLAVAPAHAQVDATAKAKTLFDAGHQAYDAGNFPAALQAFEEAYRIAPRPGLVFSIAQSHRRQYYIDKRPEHLRAALQFYREYLGLVEQGGRRAEVAQALAELDPYASQLDKTAERAPLPIAKPETRLMVTSKTKGAVVAVDGAKPVALPFFAKVKPGKHTIRVTADGYAPDEREVEAVEGLAAPVDASLSERPGRLVLTGANGAQVTVDGRLIGTAPLPQAIEVTPGHHHLAVTRSGYKLVAQEIEVGRAETKTVPVKLEQTGQRVGSIVLLATGGAALIAGGTLAAVAVAKQQTAQNIDTARAKGGRPPADLVAYDDAKGARDDMRRAAGIVAGAGVLVGITGLMLFVFDQPGLGLPALRTDERPKGSPTHDEGLMEIAAAPMVLPGLIGGTVSGRF